MKNADFYHQVARELVQAMRGKRSRQSLCRAINCADNLVSRWETGERTPTWNQFLLFASACKISLETARKRSLGRNVPDLERLPEQILALSSCEAAVASTQISLSRLQAIQKRPASAKLPEVLVLLDSVANAFLAYISGLGLPGEAIPSLQSRIRAFNTRRDIYAAHPVLGMVELCLALPRYTSAPKHIPGFIANQLGISLTEERKYLELLIKAGTVTFTGSKYLHELQDFQSGISGWDETRRSVLHFLEESRKRANQHSDFPKEDLFQFFVFTTHAKFTPEIQKLVREFWRNLISKLQTDEVHKEEQDRVAAVCVQFLNLTNAETKG
jgi:hypothetical protein